MRRHINLRQIEAFKAVVEHGTVSRAAELLNISQPAISKLIAHLEFDTELKLFDRVKRRLAPTEHGMRLYEEVGRIFAGVRQLDHAVEVIRREEQGRLAIGVLPALSNPFIERVTKGILAEHAPVFCSVHSLASQWIVDWLITRRLDVGLVAGLIDNPYVKSERVAEHPLVCVMDPGHPLAAKKRILPRDLDGEAFVAFHSDSVVGSLVARMFDKTGVRAKTIIEANVGPIIREYVAAGAGISLVHPLMMSGLEHKLVARRFEPEIMYSFKVCRNPDSRNAGLVDAFTEEVRTAAAEITRALLDGR